MRAYDIKPYRFRSSFELAIARVSTPLDIELFVHVYILLLRYPDSKVLHVSRGLASYGEISQWIL